jgi:HEAT repeat protein
MRVQCGALLLSVCFCVPFVSSQSATKESKAGPTTVGGKTLKQWTAELTSKDAGKRADAVVAIAGFGDANHVCVPDLLGRMHDTDVSPRVRAVVAMRLVAVDSKDVGKVINALLARLNRTNEEQAIVRLEAAVSLRRFVGEGALNNAVPGLTRGTLDKSSWEIRHHCVSVLWRIGREQKTGTDAAIFEALLTVVEYEKTYLVRLEALQGLGTLGKPSDTALLNKVVSKLNLYSKSENKAYAIWAYTALVGMQEGKASEVSLHAIGKFLKSERLETRIQAANALGALGSRAKSRVPMLVAMLKDPELNAVWAACNALGSIGDASDKVVDALMQLVGHKEPSRSAAAVTALVNLRVNTQSVKGTLDKMLEDKKMDDRLHALIKAALVEIDKPKKN